MHAINQNTALESKPLASRFLEQALLITILAHAAAMLSMALLLLPGMPGGNNDLAARVAYVASHPWLWRLGWLPWHLPPLPALPFPAPFPPPPWIPPPPPILFTL